jgi:hypothetical protein
VWRSGTSCPRGHGWVCQGADLSRFSRGRGPVSITAPAHCLTRAPRMVIQPEDCPGRGLGMRTSPRLPGKQQRGCRVERGPLGSRDTAGSAKAADPSRVSGGRGPVSITASVVCLTRAPRMVIQPGGCPGRASRMRTSPRLPGEQQRRVPCRGSGPMPPGIRLGPRRCRPRSFLDRAGAPCLVTACVLCTTRTPRKVLAEVASWDMTPPPLSGRFARCMSCETRIPAPRDTAGSAKVPTLAISPGAGPLCLSRHLRSARPGHRGRSLLRWQWNMTSPRLSGEAGQRVSAPRDTAGSAKVPTPVVSRGGRGPVSITASALCLTRAPRMAIQPGGCPGRASRMRTSPRLPGKQQRRVRCVESGSLSPEKPVGSAKVPTHLFLEGAVALYLIRASALCSTRTPPQPR